MAMFLGSLGGEQLSAGCRSRGSSLATRIDFVTRRSGSRPRYCALISNTPAARIVLSGLERSATATITITTITSSSRGGVVRVVRAGPARGGASAVSESPTVQLAARKIKLLKK